MYSRLAMDIMFGGVLVSEIEGKYGLVLRKNKTVEDVKEAVRRGKNAGMGKTEFELSMIEVYLKQVLKPAKGKK